MLLITYPLVSAIWLAIASAAYAASEQMPFFGHGEADLIEVLESAGIIPDVLDAFIPKLTLSIFWENATAEVGNTVAVNDVQKAPDVQFIAFTPDLVWPTKKNKKHPQLTLALTDPDAPSRDDPKWSQVCHWLATNVQLTNLDSPGSTGFSKDVVDIMPYKPPGPPPKTGRHRYVFVAMAPKNETTEKLDLIKPSERRHWGYDGERPGVREWAEEMGLEVVGANFVYAENEKQ